MSCVAASTSSTASTSSSLLANQYSTVCLRTPTAAAISSSDTASTPRVPNSSTDGVEDPSSGVGRDRWRPRPVVYHLVENRARPEPVIAESLAGKRIAITGSTGFVGTALVERLLRSVPGLPARAARA